MCLALIQFNCMYMCRSKDKCMQNKLILYNANDDDNYDVHAIKSLSATRIILQTNIDFIHVRIESMCVLSYAIEIA